MLRWCPDSDRLLCLRSVWGGFGAAPNRACARSASLSVSHHVGSPVRGGAEDFRTCYVDRVRRFREGRDVHLNMTTYVFGIAWGGEDNLFQNSMGRQQAV